jgi:hypothetical protein
VDDAMSAGGLPFSRSRQVAPDFSSILYLLYALIPLAIFIFWLNWFYNAIKRIEKSLREIEKRLESLESHH